MHFYIRKGIAFWVISIFILSIAGCNSRSDTPPPKKTTEQIQAEKIAAEQRMREYEEKKAKLESDLNKVTAGQVRSILQSCKSSVLQLAKSQNRSPFDVFLVDEYSADVYQAAAYVGSGNVSSEEQRVQQFLKARKAKEKEKSLRYALNLSYTVMFTNDSFSGPQKEPKRYMCELEPGLTVRAF